MNELEIFKNEEFGEIRTVVIDNEPWFVGKDVAIALGYSNTKDAVLRHVDGEDSILNGVEIPDSMGRKQTYRIINESGLYSLILGSKLESAKKFKHWVTSEVLPAIRKTGSYSMPTGDELMALALIEAQKTIESVKDRCKFLSDEIIGQQKVIEEMTPKANYVDMILSSKSLVTTTQIAKDYGVSAMTLNKMLNTLGVQYKVNGQWVLYSKYQNLGYTHSKTFDITRSDGRADVKMQTEWTQKGRLFIYELLKQENIVPMIEKVGE